MIINIILTPKMVEDIKNGGMLSFSYAINRCSASQYTQYDLFVSAGEGATKLNLVSNALVGWDSQKGTYGPMATDSSKATVAQWQKITITDASVLAEIAENGVLQIIVEAIDWKQKHDTNFWIDEIIVSDPNS